VKDLFSDNARGYARARPVYSREIYEFIYTKISGSHAAWDAGTGNGQVARVLAEKFEKVYATDISQAQIDQAPTYENIEYRICPAEQSGLPDNRIDLVTVAQAIHWFDLDAFEREVWRVLVPDGLFCYWGYGLPTLSHKAWDDVFLSFYQMSLPCWEPEREIVDSQYTSLQLNKFTMSRADFHLEQQWDSRRLINYVRSWSAMPRLIERKGHHVLQPLLDLPPAGFTADFPVFLYYGIKG